jgi:hypothetical protein
MLLYFKENDIEETSVAIEKAQSMSAKPSAVNPASGDTEKLVPAAP